MLRVWEEKRNDAGKRKVRERASAEDDAEKMERKVAKNMFAMW
jgi:hypothetical protein